MNASKTLMGTLTGLAALTLLSNAAAADFTVTGTVNYVDKSFTYQNGWTGAKPEMPARLAHVEVVNATTGAVLGTAITGLDGSYTINAVGSGTANVKVRAISKSHAFGSSVLRVTNASGQNYSIETPVWTAWDLTTDLNGGTLVSQLMTAGSKQGNPFNILDQMVSGMRYVKAMGSGNPSVNLRSVWPGGGGSFASGTKATIADDDGYDDIVQLHEFGHVIHNHYSDNDSPGGTHFISDSDQDPSLPVGEGWARFFARPVRHSDGNFDPALYRDAHPGSTTGGNPLKLRFENQAPYGSSIRGEADEGAVANVLWDVIDATFTDDKSPGSDDDPVDGSLLFANGQTGDELLWDAFVGPVKTKPNTTIRDHWNGIFSFGDPGLTSELVSAFDGLEMRFYNDSLEPNNSVQTATPVSLSSAWSGVRTLYYSSANPAVPGEGDSDFYSFDVCAGAVLDIATRYPGGAGDAKTYVDPYITLRRPDGTIFGQNNDGGIGRNAMLANVLTDASGTWTVEVKTIHNYRKTGSYNLKVQQISGPGGLCPCCPLNGDISALSLTLGGTQALTITAGAQHAGKWYWLLGSATGTSPGLATPAGVLPLNYDGYFAYTLSNPNLVPLTGSLGLLDGQGDATAQFSLPAGSSLSLAGLTLHHAYAVLGSLSTDMVSNAIPIALTF